MRQSYTSNAKQRAERSSVFGGGRQRIRRKARAFGTQEQFRKHGRAQRPSPTQSFHIPSRPPATRFIINKTNQRAERSSVFDEGRKRIRREATVFDTQQETWQPREGRCALPYAELVNTANIKSQKPANQREEGWNGRASRRTQIDKAIQENKTSAGIGTTVEHPPRERIVIKRTRYRRLTQRPSPTQKVLNNETG